MRYLYKILCFVTMALFLLVPAQQKWSLFQEEELTGWFPEVDFPTLSIKDFASGKWQEGVEAYLKTHHGFCRKAVRLYNQFLWTFFCQSNNASVTAGKDRYLFETYFVDDHYGKRMYEFYSSPEEMRAKCEREVQQMVQLQQLLDERGKKFLFWISPGKDLVYPEYLPRNNSTLPAGPVRAYDVYAPLLKEYGVNHIDFCSWFKEIRDSVDYDIFPPLGTHWSNLASVYAFDSVMRYLQHIGGAPIPPISIGGHYSEPPRDPDHDLEDLLNIMYTPNRKNLYYADVSVADTTMPRPRMLVVGDSFIQVINRNFPFDQLFDWLHFWSYNKIILYDPNHDDVKQVDLAQELAEADYVVVAFCTSQLYDLRGFIEEAIDVLSNPVL